MASVFNVTSISKEALIDIKNKLTLTPANQYNPYNKQSETVTIRFYKQIGNLIYLPFMFAATISGSYFNATNTYPKHTINFKGSLRDYQIPIEEKAWSQMEQYYTTTLGLYPGAGKTILGAKLASRLNLITVILVHRDILTIQWKSTFESFTDASIWIVGEKDPPPACNVIICMDTRWDKIPEEVRKLVGFLIIDEAHAFCTPEKIGCLLAFQPMYVIIESGSLERDDEMHIMMQLIVGKHGVFRESDIPFSVMKIITNTKPIRKNNRYGKVDWPSLISNTLMDPRRNSIITNLTVTNLKYKIIILTATVNHVMIIHDSLKALSVSCDYLCGNKKTYIDSNVLVGTFSKIGTGFDPATSCATYDGRPFELLILASSIKKYSMLVQNIGRVFRSEYPIVMHLVDNDSIFISHWYKASSWYNLRGGKITIHNIPNEGEGEINIPQQQVDWLTKKLKQLNNG